MPESRWPSRHGPRGPVAEKTCRPRWEVNLAELLDDLARSLLPCGGERNRRGRARRPAPGARRADQSLVGRPALRATRTPSSVELMSQQNDLRDAGSNFRSSWTGDTRNTRANPPRWRTSRRALPGDRRLIGWIDRPTAHWACVIPARATPSRVTIPPRAGMGPGPGTRRAAPPRHPALVPSPAYRPDWARRRPWPATVSHTNPASGNETAGHPPLAGDGGLADRGGWSTPGHRAGATHNQATPRPGSMFARLTVSRPAAGTAPAAGPGRPRSPAEPARDTPAAPTPATASRSWPWSPAASPASGIQAGRYPAGIQRRRSSDLRRTWRLCPPAAGAARIAVKDTGANGEVRA